jgi:hypothetical protein
MHLRFPLRIKLNSNACLTQDNCVQKERDIYRKWQLTRTDLQLTDQTKQRENLRFFLISKISGCYI